MEPISTWVFSYPINAIGGVGKYMREVRKRAGLLLLSPILCLGFSLCQDCKPKIFRLSAKYRKTKKITPPFANHAKQKAVLKRMTFFPLGLGDSFSSRVSSCQKSLVYCFACFTRGKRTGGGGRLLHFQRLALPPAPFLKDSVMLGISPKATEAAAAGPEPSPQWLALPSPWRACAVTHPGPFVSLKCGSLLSWAPWQEEDGGGQGSPSEGARSPGSHVAAGAAAAVWRQRRYIPRGLRWLRRRLPKARLAAHGLLCRRELQFPASRARGRRAPGSTNQTTARKPALAAWRAGSCSPWRAPLS